MVPPRADRRRLGWGMKLAVAVLRPPTLAIARHDFRGGEHIPATGGLVVAANHATYLDALVAGLFVWEQGRTVRYLAKAELWRSPVVGRVLTSAGHIPVQRGRGQGAEAYEAAVAAVRAGDTVIVFPEGTLTRDPDLWPMRGRTGAARIALATGAPVVPVGQWGATAVLPQYAKRPRLFPRRTVHTWAGPPVGLSDLQGRQDAATVTEATRRIMTSITEIVSRQRGQAPPSRPFDPQAAS